VHRPRRGDRQQTVDAATQDRTAEEMAATRLSE